MKQQITIKANIRGVLDQMIHNLKWAAIMAAATLVCKYFVGLILTSYEVRNLKEYYGNISFGRGISGDLLMPGLIIIGIITGIAVLVNLYGLIGIYYQAKTVTVIDKEKKILSETSYTFPYGKHFAQQHFDIIPVAFVSQSTLQRLYGAGDIQLQYEYYANSEARKGSWDICNILEPTNTMDQILEGVDVYDGMQVKIGTKK